MAKISYPFESINTGTEQDPVYDRGIDSEQERLFNRMRYTNGVFNTVGDSLKVTANNNMTVTVETGGMNIEGALFYMDAPETIQLETADPALNRVDRIVGRFDTALSIRSIDIYLKTGVAGASPVAPALSQEPNYFELALADVYVSKGTTTITTANIKDQRLNSDLCGYVLPAMPNGINTSDLWTQYEASLQDWYDTVASALDGTAAGHLQNELNTTNNEVAELTTTVGKLNGRLTEEENKVNDQAHGGTGSDNPLGAFNNQFGVKECTSANLTLKAGYYTLVDIDISSIRGTPIGIVGINISDTGTGARSDLIVTREFYLGGNTKHAYVGTRNVAETTTAKYNVAVYVLYVKEATK